MSDVVTPEVRSRMMAGIRGFNTKPELFLRKGLHRRGFRFKLHDRTLAGCPDMVLKSRGAVLFAHGCFWHRHDCTLFKWPTNRADFWQQKLNRNRLNDERSELALLQQGWRVGVVWECALKGPGRLTPDTVLDRCESWLRSARRRLEIRGTR